MQAHIFGPQNRPKSIFARVLSIPPMKHSSEPDISRLRQGKGIDRGERDGRKGASDSVSLRADVYRRRIGGMGGL